MSGFAIQAAFEIGLRMRTHARHQRGAFFSVVPPSDIFSSKPVFSPRSTANFREIPRKKTRSSGSPLL
jgi:hypothetical protein